MPLPAWAKPIQNTAPPAWAKPIEAQPQPEVMAQERETPGFFSRVGEDIAEHGEKVGQMIGRQTAGGVVEGIKNIPTMAALTAGQAAGAVGDIAGEGLVSTYKTVVPEATQQAISGGISALLNTKIGQQGVKALQSGGEVYSKFKSAYPDAALALEGAANIATALPVTKGTTLAAKEGRNILGDVSASVSAPAKNKLAQVITQGYEKGVRPTVSGKGTFTKGSQAAQKAEEAVKEIISRKGSLSLTDEFGDVVQGETPKNLKQFAEAIEQTKRGIYNEYSSMASAAGEAGVVFDTKPILDNLNKVSTDVKYNPQIRKYAESLMDEVGELKGQTPDVIEARIADLNKSLQGFYEGRVGKAKAEVDASVARLMREQLDNDITSAISPGYQDLKNKYGAIKSIEKEVNQRATVFARQNQKGIADLSDIFTGGEIVGGAASLLAGNPAGAGSILSGIAGKMVKGRIKDINNADNIIKNMFEKAEGIIQKRTEPFPKSATGQYLGIKKTPNALAKQGE